MPEHPEYAIERLEDEIEKLEIERDNALRAIDWLTTDEAGDFLEEIIDFDIADIQVALRKAILQLV